MIESYIHYYNTRRVQRDLGVLMPTEKHEFCLAAKKRLTAMAASREKPYRIPLSS